MFAPRATTVALVLPDRAGLLERIGLAAAQLGLVAPKLPLPFYDAYLGLLGARAVMAATRLGIVEALAERPDTVDCLARRLALDAERLDVLLTALVTLGYVRRRRDGRFAPTRTARRWLTGDRSVEGFAGPLAYANWEAMRGLEDALRGAPPTGWHEPPDDDPQWEGYQRAMAQMERMLGDDLAAAIPVEAPRTLLDLAGGPGLHAAALIRRHPGLQATVVDLPAAAAAGSAGWAHWRSP
jgi:DNA-binding transcriptional ArsR family regulator